MKHYHLSFNVYLCIIACICFFHGMNSIAYADTDVYLGVKLGHSHTFTTPLKENWGLKKALGYSPKIGSSDTFLVGGMVGISHKFISELGIRGEVEYAYRIPNKPKINIPSLTTRLSSHTLLINLFLDYYIISDLSIYIGGGGGFSIIDLDVKGGIGPAFAPVLDFAAQGGGGIRYAFADNFILDLNVRYMYLGEWLQTDDSYRKIRGTFSAIETTLALAYEF